MTRRARRPRSGSGLRPPTSPCLGAQPTSASTPPPPVVVLALSAVMAALLVPSSGQSVSPSPSPQPSFLADVVLFTLGSTWRVLDGNVDLAGSTASPRWIEAAFDDSTWLSGPASLGFGFTSVQGEKTTLTVGAGPLLALHAPLSSLSTGFPVEPLALAACTLPQVRTSPTYYYRKKVTISVGSSMQLTAVVGVRCDDGAVLYINGQEVGRRNMPTGAIGHNTMAATGYVRPPLPWPTHGTLPTVPFLLHPSV